MKKFACLLAFAVAIMVSHTARSQGIFNKLKDKANKALEKKVEQKAGVPSDNPDNSNNNNNNNNSTDNNSNSRGKPVNKGGGGLTNTQPPDVQAQMTEAEAAHRAKNYSDARYSLQQALMGVEIQLGKQILRSLPPGLNTLVADTTQDKVVSTQWGWSNLTIQRVYSDQADKQLTIMIGNAGMYANVANLYWANSSMIEANGGGQQNMKQVRVKGNKALIQYDDSKGYTLMVSMGQTSMIVFECINFANEQEVMTAANTFDIDGIKKMLGEK